MKKIGLLITFICSFFLLTAQDFGRADSLRGFLFPERNCYDVLLSFKFKSRPQEKFIKGFTHIHFDALTDFDVIQIDYLKN